MGRPKQTIIHDWPYLMRPVTARAYLDGMSVAAFQSLVAPYSERRELAGTLYFSRKSIDDWIMNDPLSGQRQTTEDVIRDLRERRRQILESRASGESGRSRGKPYSRRRPAG